MRVDAYAKLTLSLRVTGVRPDGYHELDAVMVSITEPHDELAITPAGTMSLTITGPYADGVPADASNLAWQAAAASTRESFAIEIHKGIPHGAGLGGGSADAAAVLVALGADPAIGARLGADVPFCMRGGAARVRGVGDEVEAVDVPELAVVTVTPPFGCSTAAVYRAWDELGGPQGEHNDLEPAALHVEPRLAEWRARIEHTTGRPALLAGSGSSYAVLFDDAHDAARARADLEVALAGRGSVFAGRTTGEGVAVRE